ncbi:hypothetical protein Syun_010426 [Stephania yunnanensis]|uniref:Receptor-like serine/threonine-protein kinase n=1 Tax=Stephania yunnanensis TaxID=152371 RepID=A0AAP0KIS8_9MAGN
MDTISNPPSKSFLIAFLWFILSFAPCHSISTSSTSDTMFAGQLLTANKTLVSKERKFELGFFTPGNSKNYYIGIWFRQVFAVQKKKTIVWVANRNKPITINDSSSSELKLIENGQLVLMITRTQIPIWSTDSTPSRTMNDSSVKAVLRDDGNLVILSSTNGNVLWESFDHPTHVHLPGARLGYNGLTKKAMKVTSWRNTEDPSDGIYSIELGPDKSFSLIWNGSQKFYNSGVWNGRFFSNIPEMQVGYGFMSSFGITSYENGSYDFIYLLSNKTLPFGNFLDTSGQSKASMWSSETRDWTVIWTKPLLHCQVYGVCGAFGVCSENNIGPSVCQCLSGFEHRYPKDWDLLDYSGGCARRSTLQCGNEDSFSKMPNMRLTKISPSANALAADNARKCELACLQNCSCSAYSYNTNSNSSGNSIQCLLWYGDLLNIEQLSGDEGNDLYIRLARSQGHELGSKTKASTIWIIVGVVLSGTIIFLGITFLFLRKRGIRRLISRTPKQEEAYAFLTAFRYKDLKLATKNFSDKLGSGGFGTVYKGILPDSTAIAVKKLEGFSQDQKQFRSEVSTIGLIQHVNLVRLRGFCSEGRKQMLVYDLIANGSLDKYLKHQNDSIILNWQQRYQIATGVARGLAYLHEKCRDCIIHCDIKPENVLLEVDFSPRIADFGLAKLLGREFSRVMTSMRGTVGYLAPEWTSGVAITAKADVYSYGMMLFEIISGTRNLKQFKNGKMSFFPTWASRKVIAEGQPVLSILDNNLDGKADIEELNRAFRVACWCVQEEEYQRPSMGQVVQILEGLLEVNPPPILSYLQVIVDNEDTASFFSE